MPRAALLIPVRGRSMLMSPCRIRAPLPLCLALSPPILVRAGRLHESDRAHLRKHHAQLLMQCAELAMRSTDPSSEVAEQLMEDVNPPRGRLDSTLRGANPSSQCFDPTLRGFNRSIDCFIRKDQRLKRASERRNRWALWKKSHV